jgi:putative Flp pilus-assembly TadE/G-like protein
MMKRPAGNSSERGQVLITTAAGLFVLMAIAAIVVDLGMSWMLHRQEQNAADPGAIAAARWLRDPVTGAAKWDQTSAEGDACFYAQQNGFFEGDAGCVVALGSGQLQVHSPPVSGPYTGSLGKVQVIISDTHPTFFGRVLGADTATVTTGAVAANDADNGNSSSLIALQNVCQAGSAGSVSGGGTVNIFPVTPDIAGGYVHVNSPCGTSTDNICSNGVGSSALQISGTLTTPYAYVNGSCTYNGSGANGLICADASPCLEEDAVPMGDPLFDLPEPAPADFPNGFCPNGDESLPSATTGCDLPTNGPDGDVDCPKDVSGVNVCRLSPGVFYGGWTVGAKVRLELEPGMYILAGGGIKLSGTSSSIEAVQDPSGIEARIMLFSTDGPMCATVAAHCEGAITFTAQQAFKAKALNSATCGIVTPQACPWKGILLWQDGTVLKGAKAVTLGGQSSTILAGTIYAPASQVNITGGSATTGCSTGPTSGCLSIQLISWRWTITGGGTLDMPYDPAEIYQVNLRGLVH